VPFIVLASPRDALLHSTSKLTRRIHRRTVLLTSLEAAVILAMQLALSTWNHRNGKATKPMGPINKQVFVVVLRARRLVEKRVLQQPSNYTARKTHHLTSMTLHILPKQHTKLGREHSTK